MAWWNPISSSKPPLSARIPVAAPAPPMPTPEGVDFEALWEEPTDASSLPTILSGVAAATSGILLVMHFFGK